jgi:HlyD family secretion protein
MFAKVAGYVSVVYVDIGDRVKSGQSLLDISVPEMKVAFERSFLELQLLRLRHEQMEAEVNVARAEFSALDSESGRVQELLKNKAVSQRVGDETASRRTSAKAQLSAAEIEVKTAAVAVEVAQKTLEELETLMAYATVKAPFDGVVARRNVDPGDFIRNSSTSPTGDPLFIVVKTDLLRVRVPVPERDAIWVDPGDAAEITFMAIPEKVFKGQVARTSGALDPMTRTLDVEIDLPNEDGALLPGMYGTVVIVTDTKTALVVPADTVRVGPSAKSEKTIYVVRDGNVRITPVKTGIDDGRSIEILSGIGLSDRIVTGMLGRLKDGQSVTVLAE